MFTSGTVVQLKVTESEDFYTALKDRESVELFGAHRKCFPVVASIICPVTRTLPDATNSDLAHR